MKIFPLLCWIAAFHSQAAKIQVKNASGLNRDLGPLEQVASEALFHFEKHWGPLKEDIQIRYGGSPCLRVAYVKAERVVTLCALRGVLESGIRSVDVLRHELFHAMFCQLRPDACRSEESNASELTDLHEALADYFAYTLAPDESFGENFYVDRPYIRKYRTEACHSLLSNAYERGTTLVNFFIENSVKLSELKVLLSGEFSTRALLAALGRARPPCLAEADLPMISARPVVGLPSQLNRYRVPAAQKMALKFFPNEATLARYPDLTLRWSVGPGSVPGQRFSVRPRERSRWIFEVSAPRLGYATLDADFYSKGHRVGGQTFYFSVLRKGKTSSEKP